MADNVAISSGTGTDIATDQVTGTGEHVQLMKLAYAADGSRVLVPADADGLLVNLGVNNDVTVTGSVTANAGTNLNTSALALDATLTGRTQKAQVTDGTRDGTIKAASTLPLATDTALVTTLRDALPAGANVIGALSANQSANVAQVGGASVVAAATGVQKVGVSDSIGQAQYNFPAGFVRTSDEPHQLFYDPFDAALDTTNRWNAATAAGGGVAAAVTAGVLALGSGTTINGYSYLASQASFVPTIPSWLGDSWAIQIEAGATAGTNAVRFWGCGLVIGTPTSAAPLGTGNGYGFKIGTDGVLKAVVYAAGTETIVADLASVQPTDGAYHRYIVYYRTDRIFWYVESLATAAATSNFQGPQVQTLPVLALVVAHSSAPAASRVINCTGLAVWDTGKNNATISDGLYGWRKATVKAASVAAAAGDPALVVSFSPNSPIPQNTLTKGTQGATGISTQDLKDAGRNQTNYFHAAPIITTTAEVMQTLTGYKGGAAVAATATPAVVTTGKTYRITLVEITYIAATVIGSARVNLRANLSGVGVVGSPLVKSWQVGMPAIFTAGAAMTYSFPFPDGLEFAAGTGIAVGVIGEGAVPTTGTITGYVMVAIHGYEY